MINLKRILKLVLNTLFIAAVIALLWTWRTNILMQRLSKNEQIVAKVNDYVIYASDFETAIKPPMANEDLKRDPRKIKERILNDLIMRKTLVQAAQIEGFDKEKIFMKTIERYWEQTLLKFLLTRKSDELLRSIHISDDQIQERYNRSKHQYFAEVVYLKDVESAKRLSEADEKFDQIKESVSNHIAQSEPAQWWNAGDLPSMVEDQIVSLSPGQVSQVMAYNDQWVVIRLIKLSDLAVKPFERSAEGIRAELAKKLMEDNLSKWIDRVRKGAKVTINYDVLDQMDLQEIYGTNEKQGGSDEDHE